MKRTAWMHSLLAFSLLALLSCDAPETAEEQSDTGAPSDTTSGTDAALDAEDDATLDDTADAGGDGSAADTELTPDGSGEPDTASDAGADTSPVPCSADADCPSLLCLLDAGATEGACASPCSATSDCAEGDLCLTIPGSALLGACVALDYCRDLDGDLAGSGPGCSARDCNDGSSAIGPGIPEECDGVDQDCDGAVDEEAGCSAAGESCDVLLDCAVGLLCDAGLCLASAVCGDGSRGGAEQCDDGNVETERCLYGAASCEVCDSGCLLVAGVTSRCGDGERNLPDEACDSGDSVDLNCAYGERSCLVCNAFCSLVEGQTTFCGDGVASGAERCDDGNLEQTDGCGNDCSCSAGFHLTGTTCEVDVRSCLLPNALVAEERWNGISYDTCAPVSCNPTYHLEGGSCRSDQRSCSLPDAVVAVETWTGAGYGPCTASACAAGLHVEAGVCVSNQRACSQFNATAALESWNGTEYAGCTATACEADFHLESGACLSDTRSCSLANAVTAVSRWNGSSFGTCEAVSCVTEYHVEAQQCLFDLRACTAANATFALERWSAGAYRDCTPTTCIANYHVEGGVCEPNTRSCAADAAISGEQYWLGTGYSTCAATSCLSGYHLEGSACRSDTRSCSPLPSNTSAGTQTWDGNSYGACTATACVSTFHLESGICMSDAGNCPVANGTGIQSWTGSAYGPCILATCNTGYHEESGVCVSDTRSCSLSNGTGSQSYALGSWGACGPVSCSSDFHLESGACVSDTRGCAVANGTGSQTYTLGSWDTCAVASCNSAFHAESGACVSDMRSCSPLPSNTSAGTQTWTGSGYGTCIATACISNFHVERSVCVSDTRSCAVANGTGSQSWTGSNYGPCVLATCNAAYHVESGACVSDTRSCSIANGTGSESWTGSSYSSCAAVSCNTAYHVESGACASNSRSCAIANGSGIQTWTGSGFGACTVTGCDLGFELVAGGCSPPACNDGIQNGLESDIDCGGPLCGASCAETQRCSGGTDCVSSRCESGFCSTCADGIQTGSETDIDCGGVCITGLVGRCVLTQTCLVDDDCASGICASGRCAAVAFDCFNGVQDARETGVDCGGSDCAAKCLVGAICRLNSDCASGVCAAGICSTAAPGGSCLSGSDCNHGVCSGGSPTAQTTLVDYTTPDDTWTTISGLSTDSAKTASPIAIGFSMNYFGNQYTTFDATSNGWMALGANSVASSTTNLTLPSATAKNAIALFAQDSGSATAPVATYRYKLFGTAPFRKLIYDVTANRSWYNTASVTYTAQAVLFETTGRVEVVCNPCTQETTRPATQGVTNATGTVSAFLTGRNNGAFSATDTAVFDTLAGRTCAAPANNDGVKNGSETDVDCGGSSGIACGYNLICAVDSDCKSAECNSGLCAKSTTGEACATGVDCLGANCASSLCSVGGGDAACLVNADCASATCDRSAGTPGVCGKLAEGASCAVNNDCQSDYCLAGTATDSQPGVYAATYASIEATKPDCTTATCFSLGDATKSPNQTLPFSFTFFGVEYSSFFISPDGYISFDTTESNTNGSANIALPAIATAGAHPAVSPGPAIFLYWMDGNATGADSIRYWTEGTAPNRRAIIAYSSIPNWSASGGSYTGQIILNETSNTVEVQIEAGVQGTTLGARTRGVRNADGTQALYYQGSSHLDSENNRPFPSTTSTTFSNSRRLYRTNPAAATCAAAGSRGAACVSDAGCTSGACVTSGVATALAAPGATPPADFQTSAAAAASSAVSSTSQTLTYPTATGVTLPMPIGFPYRFYGRNYTSLRGAASGYLSFLSTTTSSATFANLETSTTTSQNGLIAYWWRSMGAFSGTNNATFSTTGTAPFRVFTYDVNGLTNATAQPVRARVQLYESTSIIDVSCYSCGVNTGTVSNSAQGIETADGTTNMGTPARVLTTASGGTNAARHNTAYRFNTGSAAVCF